MSNDPYPKTPSILGSAKVLFSELITNFSERESWNITKILIEELTGEAWFRFRTDPERCFSSEQWKKWQDWSARISAQEPLHYILGKAWFRDFELIVGPGVLVPRPETEELVHWVLDTFGSAAGLRVLDIGTGSGCIAISLACGLQAPEVRALDISPQALSYARRNAEACQAKIEFLEMDLALLPKQELPPLDLIVCNPPYVLESDRPEMEAHVLQHEPDLALFVPDDRPLLYYIKVADIAKKMLAPGGWLFFEIHELFGDAVQTMLAKKGFINIDLRKDLSEKARMVRGQNIS